MSGGSLEKGGIYAGFWAGCGTSSELKLNRVMRADIRPRGTAGARVGGAECGPVGVLADSRKGIERGRAKSDARNSLTTIMSLTQNFQLINALARRWAAEQRRKLN